MNWGQDHGSVLMAPSGHRESSRDFGLGWEVLETQRAADPARNPTAPTTPDSSAGFFQWPLPRLLALPPGRPLHPT